MRQPIETAPKAELHLHIEGSISPEMVFRLAERNKMPLAFETPEALAASFKFTDLASFSAAYRQSLTVLQLEDDFFDLTYDYMRRAHMDHVVHVEVALAPHNHITRGIPIEVAMGGLLAGLKAGAQDFGISSAVILGAQKQRGEEASLAMLEMMLPYKDQITALGLAGMEVGNPPSGFKRLFDRARSLGWRTVAHAGEEGPADYVRQAVEVLKVDRVDHGVRAEEDPDLIKLLVDRQIPLTVCPLSNVCLRVFDTLADHNVARLFRAGVMVTINSDDPPFFGGDVNENFTRSAAALDMTLDEQFAIARNSLVAAFMPDDLRRHHLGQLDDAWAVAKAEPVQ
jgi:adenosine deaminase